MKKGWECWKKKKVLLLMPVKLKLENVMNILLIGSGAREHAIARAIKRSKNKTNLFCFGSNINPGIKELCAKYKVDRVTDVSVIVSLAQEKKLIVYRR